MKRSQRLPGKAQNKPRGFTLVEVLVALMILALALLALQLRMGNYLDDAGYLRDKTLASWVALNQLELLQIAERLELEQNLEQLSGTGVMMHRNWYWHLVPERVSMQSADDAAAVSLFHMQVSPLGPVAARTEPLVTLVAVQGMDNAP